MPRRLLPALLTALVLVAAVVFAELGPGFESRPTPPHAQAAAEPEEPSGSDTDPEQDPGSDMALPPDHPPIDRASMPPSGDGAPAISWEMPSDWQEAPNPNSVRLATYRTPAGGEMSVSRAGGSTDANIQRWIGQFDDAGAVQRETKTVHGLHVTTVQVAGTYRVSMMAAPGAATGGARGAGQEKSEVQPNWALLGAIVEAPGSPYFFKLVGPARAIQLARPSFDRLVAGLAPR